MILIASHNNGQGAHNLAVAMGCRLVSHSSEKNLPKKTEYVLNFGCSPDHPAILRAERSGVPVFNRPEHVATASSKLATFNAFATHAANNGASRFYPKFYTDLAQANFASLVEGKTLVARQIDRGSSGAGIVVATPDDVRQQGGLPRARLYTEAIDKGREYRVHVGMSNTGDPRIIDITRKIRKPDATGDRPFIWNHDNDFIFVREGVNESTIPRDLFQVAVRALRAVGLQYGAVDIVCPRRGRLAPTQVACYALEVNSAPGMEGTTVDRYAAYFDHLLRGANLPAWNTTTIGDVVTEDDV
jgi:hypothetical protein